MPSLRKISAATGTINVGTAGGVLKWTWASEPGISSPVAVVHVDLDQQGAAGRIDGVGGPHQRALKDLAGVLGKGQVNFIPRFTLCE